MKKALTVKLFYNKNNNQITINLQRKKINIDEDNPPKKADIILKRWKW